MAGPSNAALSRALRGQHELRRPGQQDGLLSLGEGDQALQLTFEDTAYWKEALVSSDVTLLGNNINLEDQPAQFDMDNFQSLTKLAKVTCRKAAKAPCTSWGRILLGRKGGKAFFMNMMIEDILRNKPFSSPKFVLWAQGRWKRQKTRWPLPPARPDFATAFRTDSFNHRTQVAETGLEDHICPEQGISFHFLCIQNARGDKERAERLNHSTAWQSINNIYAVMRKAGKSGDFFAKVYFF